MNKMLFKKLVMDPLEKEFNSTIYFNGKLAREMDLIIPPFVCGIAHIHKKHKPIAIIWQRNIQDTVQTLFHEIGHIYLHGWGTGFNGGHIIREIEAETTAKRACELLNLPYNPYFKFDKDTVFIDNYMAHKSKRAQPRIDKIEECAIKIYELLKEIKF